MDSATFGYTEEDLKKDIIEIENITDAEPSEGKDMKTKIVDSGKKTLDNISGLFSKKKLTPAVQGEDVMETLKKLSELKDVGIITEEEFSQKKAELLAKI